jgi:hypothetical protein
MSNADSYREEIEADVHIDLYGTLENYDKYIHVSGDMPPGTAYYSFRIVDVGYKADDGE